MHRFMKKNILTLLISFFVLQVGCAQENTPMIETPETTNYTYEIVVDGVDIPWGMAFISSNELLVTEKSGIYITLKRELSLKLVAYPRFMSEVKGDYLM